MRFKSINQPKVLDFSILLLRWCLFGQSNVFRVISGLFEIAGAVLIVINPTVIIGALFLLPVLVRIFIVDVFFTTTIFGFALPGEVDRDDLLRSADPAVLQQSLDSWRSCVRSAYVSSACWTGFFSGKIYECDYK